MYSRKWKSKKTVLMMTTYVVSFEINNKTTRNKLVEKLKAYGSFCPINEHCWAIKCEGLPIDVLNNLRSAIEPADRLFVIRSGIGAAWVNAYGEAYTEWLKNNL